MQRSIASLRLFEATLKHSLILIFSRFKVEQDVSYIHYTNYHFVYVVIKIVTKIRLNANVHIHLFSFWSTIIVVGIGSRLYLFITKKFHYYDYSEIADDAEEKHKGYQWQNERQLQFYFFLLHNQYKNIGIVTWCLKCKTLYHWLIPKQVFMLYSWLAM